MITVDKNKCIGCGVCARICHEQCISLAQHNGTKMAHVDHELCSTCTQCIAICSQQALSWDRVTAVPNNKSQLPTAVQLEELLRQRRTVRLYWNRKIKRALLEKIVNFGTYAPTNNYNLRAIVVDHLVVIEAFDRIIMKQMNRVYRLIFKSKITYALGRLLSPDITPKNEVKMANSVARGCSYKTPPAAMVFVAGDRRIIWSEASAHYALYNMTLIAQTHGIGSRINSAGPLLLDRSREARKLLALQKGEHILATLDLGYPALQFKNKVEGKQMPIAWVSGERNGR